jgi:hypothetical protein
MHIWYCHHFIERSIIHAGSYVLKKQHMTDPYCFHGSTGRKHYINTSFYLTWMDIHPLSNNVFCGTDCDGNLTEPVKIDDKWHITGELNIRTKSYLKVVLNRLKIVTTAYPELKIMVLLVKIC